MILTPHEINIFVLLIQDEIKRMGHPTQQSALTAAWVQDLKKVRDKLTKS